MLLIPLFFSTILFAWHLHGHLYIDAVEKSSASSSWPRSMQLFLRKKQTSKTFSAWIHKLLGILSLRGGDIRCDGPDEVYPIHFIDQAAIVRSSIISYVFRFNEVLDGQKLHDSLVKLLETGDWRKLGGRLRQNRDGKLEIHVPQHFSPGRPPIRFSHTKFDVKIDEHPLASRLPKKTGNKPSIHAGCHVFGDFFVPQSLPRKIKHYLTTDEPLICLYLNSFKDATLVGLTFPHSLADAMGTADLLQTWSSVLQSAETAREMNRVYTQPVHMLQVKGAREDIIASVGDAQDKTAHRTKFVLEHLQTRGLSLVIFIARFAWDLLTRHNVEPRHIYLPASFLSHLRREAEKELRRGNQKAKVPFFSDGDLITAWGARMVLSSAPSKTSALICNVFDMRSRLRLPPGEKGVYLQNLILPSTTILTHDEAQSLPVAQLALRVRRAIVEQTSDAQVRNLMRLAREWFTSLGTMPLFARWDTARIIAVTNWTKGRFLDTLDFEAGMAAVPSAAGHLDKKTLAGKPVAFWGTTLSVNDKPRDVFVIYGKDADGDYWVHAYLRMETWNLVQEELERYVTRKP